MNQNYQVIEEDGISIITLKKKLNFDDMVALLSSVLNKTHSKLRLWIVTDCINFTTDEIRQFADSGKMKWPRDSRVAYVAADNLSFGLVKMFEVFSDEDNFEKKFFRLKEDAMDWLKSWNEKK